MRERGAAFEEILDRVAALLFARGGEVFHAAVGTEHRDHVDRVVHDGLELRTRRFLRGGGGGEVAFMGDAVGDV